jgi:hypothetical protein
VWGGDSLTKWGVPFWEQDLADGIKLLRQATETHVDHELAPRTADGRPRLGLVVEITDGVETAYRRRSSTTAKAG